MNPRLKALVAVLGLIAAGVIFYVYLGQERRLVSPVENSSGPSAAQFRSGQASPSSLPFPQPKPEAAPSVFARSQWARESELTAQGRKTPKAAYESLLQAATSGDVSSTAASIFLTEEARKRAEKLRKSMPEDHRTRYATDEELIAFLYIGASGITGSRPGEVCYQFVADEPGIGITPLALGLEESMASNPAYETIRSKARSPSGKESEPVAVFFQTTDGWKWVIPPSMIDGLGRTLKKGLPTQKE